MILYCFGNIFSSSVWYVLVYLEVKNCVKYGDWVWQIVLGLGFKCNSVIWRFFRFLQEGFLINCWFEFIDKYFMEIVIIFLMYLIKVEFVN